MPDPGQKKIIQGAIADYWMDGGILVSDSKNILRTVALIRDNVALVKEITGHKPVPLLIYLSKSPVPDKETRDFSAKMLPEIYTAMAMVSKPGLSRFIMNLLFALKPPPIPMKSFTDEQAAKMWLQQFL